MSGSTIGAVVGAGIGFALGPIGALAASTVVQIGWVVGSVVGGYVDPVRIQGPRLTDARAQTSTVGGQIPFGYGRFTTAGNIIWAGKLVETKKTQRQGKGSGAKTTTYSYNRSYAIGICQGPIQGLLWIKRNGKKVWTSDPSAPVEDKDYAAKWGQKLTIYTGSEDQMPDSTIVAAKGSGNVSAFRGLAYVVIEDDDLTDVAGAVPQYEFCVIATPPEAYFTSKVYPQIFYSNTTTAVSISSGDLLTVLREGFIASDTTTAVGILAGEISPPPLNKFYSDTTTAVSITDGVIQYPELGTIISDTTTAVSIESGDVRATPVGTIISDTTTAVSITEGQIT